MRQSSSDDETVFAERHVEGEEDNEFDLIFYSYTRLLEGLRRRYQNEHISGDENEECEAEEHQDEQVNTLDVV